MTLDKIQWDAILADEASGPVSDEDRQWWVGQTGPLDQFRQDQADLWSEVGYWDGIADRPLAVQMNLRELPWCVDTYVRGYQRGHGEREIEEVLAARERLPLDDREPPEREN